MLFLLMTGQKNWFHKMLLHVDPMNRCHINFSSLKLYIKWSSSRFVIFLKMTCGLKKSLHKLFEGDFLGKSADTHYSWGIKVGSVGYVSD